MTDPIRVLFPVGMLGGGFPPETVTRGIELGADIIAVDGGSTDSGPHYLGTATAKTARAAVERDLRVLVPAAHEADIPLVVGSCGTSGCDAGVEWVHEIVQGICADLGISRRIARVYSEQDPARIADLLAQGRVHPLGTAEPLRPETVARCRHIVGLMGHEPLADALRDGAEIVLAGRSTDTALAAVLPLLRGLPPGPAWHAAKIAECGGLCTENPRAGGVLVTVDDTGFTVEPLAVHARCTTRSVAAHMLYENADPFRLREPAGTLNTSDAVYTALDERRVRVEGSRFEPAEQPTIKLEGAASTGFQAQLITGIRDPEILGRLDDWCRRLIAYLDKHVPSTFGLAPGEYDYSLRRFGHDAVLGAAEPERGTPPREVGILLTVTAPDQATADDLAKFANPMMLHLPLDDDSPFPTFAFVGSPAETARGESFEFVLQHAVDVADERDLFRTVHSEVGP
ncbi:acyclic terpene utilization AtuA family protein [Amycolatopsis sp. NPDC006131]|uniref:acyclic terpene utilization AtuA family protein n=1 Tax=Amycolatopsis sp. NPDC006131 TaxID=3156731 RepID=UPI0033A154D0